MRCVTAINAGMSGNEAFSRVRIDAQLKDAGWSATDGRSIRFEYPLSDGTRADYVLCDEQGRPMAMLEAKRASASLGAAEPQAIAYARALGLDLVFLANGEKVRFCDLATDAHFRPVATVFAQADLARRVAIKTLRRPVAAVAIVCGIGFLEYRARPITAPPTAPSPAKENP